MSGVLLMLGQLAIKVSVVLTAVALLDVGILRRRASAAMRHFAWVCAIVAALLMPLFSAVLPAIRFNVEAKSAASHVVPFQVDPRIVPTSPAHRANSTKTEAPLTSTVPQALESRKLARSSAFKEILQNWPTGIVVVYAVGLLMIMAKLVVEQLSVRALVRRAVPERRDAWTAAFAKLDSRGGVRLLRSHDPTLPITTGVVRPTIIIPSDVDDWSVERREAVLMHELAHVRRRDCLTQTLAAVACALYWPHPLIWLGAARLRAERELACDDLVLARGVSAHDYAAHLLGIARSMSGKRPVPVFAVSMAAASQLESRIRAVIDDRRRRQVPSARALGVMAALVLAMVAPLSAVTTGNAQAAAVAAPDKRVIAPAPAVPAPAVTEREVPRVDESTRQPSTSPSAKRQPTLRGGQFNVRITTEQEGSFRPGLVHLSMFSPGLNTFYTPIERFNGLTAEDLRSSNRELRFTLRRDAGVLEFTGAMRGSYGHGNFVFQPDPAYAAEFVRRGIGKLTEQDHFVLGLHELPLTFLDELATQGYPTPSVGDLVRTAMSSVDLEFLRDMKALGYRAGSLRSLVQLSDNGVNPTFIRKLADQGQRGLPLETILRIRMRGDVETDRRDRQTPQDVDDRRGSRTAPTDADSPLNGRWTIDTRRDGALRLAIEWADVNQWNRDVDASILAGLSVNDLNAPTTTQTAFRYVQDAGTFEFHGSLQSGRGSGQFTFSPNHRFAETLRDLGVRDVSSLSNHDLKNLGFYGMSAAYVRDFLALGLGPLTKDQVIEMAIREVTPEYVRGMQAAAVQGADSVRTLVELRFLRVPVAYARDMGGLGYHGIPAHQLTALYQSGVTPNLVRRLRDAGQRNLTPDQLIDLVQRRR